MLNTALAALSAAGGGIYELPPGKIRLAATLVVPDNVTVVGATTAGVAGANGTILSVNAGITGVQTGAFSGLRNLSIISDDNGNTASPAYGVNVLGPTGDFYNVLVSKFGKHGWNIDSTSANGSKNLNKLSIHNCRAYGNGGDGIHIVGADSNASLISLFDASANKGTGIWNGSSRNTFQMCHVDSAGIGIAAVRDNGISSIYNVYVESSANGGSDFILGPQSVYGIVDAPLYAQPIIKGEGGTTTPFLSWRIYEKAGHRRFQLNDTFQGSAAGASWAMDSGVVAPDRFRLSSLGVGSALEIPADLSYFLFRAPVRCPSYTTASRPSATTAGAGAMIYDSTLMKPLWSTGGAWRDASGTVV